MRVAAQARGVRTMSGGDAMRRQNLGALLRRVHVAGSVSRAALTKDLGLTRTTVGVLVGELLRRGLLIEEPGEAPGTPGRPSLVVRARPDRYVALAAEIAVDSMTVATVGVGGQVLDQVRVTRTRRRVAPRRIIDDLAALLLAQAEKAGDALIVGCGVAFYGIVRRADGFVHLAPNLHWRDVSFTAELSEALGARFPVVVGNDADLGGLAEYIRGAGHGASTLLYISSEVGVGGGLVVNGRPFGGAGGYAGEIGHVVVNPGGIACRCGSRGCWETEVGELALLRHAGRSTAGNRRRTLAAVLSTAATGEPTSRNAVEEVGRWFGLGLAGLLNILNPDRVVVGGLLAEIYPLVEDIVHETLRTRALAATRDMAQVLPSALRGDAALLGAAELALMPLLDDPAGVVPKVDRAAATA